MQIARAYIQNFRCIKSAEIYPTKSNVILGPNNVGKTAYLEALNLVLNPEISYRGKVIDENDFYQREYFPAIREKSVGTSDSEISVEESDNEEPEICGSDDEMDEEPEIAVPEIYIELTLCNLSIEDEDKFRENLVPWDKDECYVVDSTDEGEDPFDNAETAIRVFFKGWYDLEEDDFDYCTKFLPSYDMDHEECSIFSREQKRYIGFLIYRDFRALTRPVTLEPGQLFNRVLQSYGVTPHQFEKVLISVRNSLEPVNQESDFSEILDHFKNEIEKYLTLSGTKSSALEFDLTDRTRYQLKSTAQLQIKNEIYLPIQRSGAGTRSLTILSMLLMIMRKRGRGILVLEEPETFLFPHAQRRVIDEAILLASQIFVSTHSPFVLERMPIDGTGRIVRDESDDMYWNLLPSENIKKVNLYSKRLRQAHCEAIMGTGVVIVEGDSDRWWLNGASRLLNKYEYNGKPLEAFELLGISVTSAETDGDIIKLGEFFYEAGLRVIGLFDCPNNPEIISSKLTNCEFPCICLNQKGLEEILSKQLPEELLRDLLIEAPHCKTKPLDKVTVSSMDENDVRSTAQQLLIKNKGSALMHEWMLANLTPDTIPETLISIIELVTMFLKSENDLNSCSLLN